MPTPGQFSSRCYGWSLCIALRFVGIFFLANCACVRLGGMTVAYRLQLSASVGAANGSNHRSAPLSSTIIIIQSH